MMVSTRQTAAERRDAVLAAAVTEFAKSGYAGTSTDAIAKRAGISQPYLFRLFGTKKDLFIATLNLVDDRIVRELTNAIKGLDSEEAMHAMGMAYLTLLQDTEMLQMQMHSYAAATSDPDIAAACRRTFEVLWHLVKDKLGLDQEMIQDFFANGMLISVMSAIDLLSVKDEWAQSICPGMDKFEAMHAMARARSTSQNASPAKAS
jgi:AcrR family transcriptional regulator